MSCEYGGDALPVLNFFGTGRDGNEKAFGVAFADSRTQSQQAVGFS
jgi:hypothetical protein